MIIKKKYLEAGSVSTPAKAKEPEPIKKEMPAPKKSEPEAAARENNLITESSPPEPPKPEPPAKKTRTRKNNPVLNTDEIKFEPRPERREGTRRRGYRRTEDRNIVSRAKQDAVIIKENAHEEGYKAGIEHAQADIAEIREKLSEFFGYKDEIFNAVSDCIYEIAIETAKKIINKEVTTDKEYIIPLIKAAVEEINRTENKIIIKVMPKDTEIVKEKLPEIFVEGEFDASISVLPDKTIQDGGVIIETSNGIIDATIETQIAIMEKIMTAQKPVESESEGAEEIAEEPEETEEISDYSDEIEEIPDEIEPEDEEPSEISGEEDI